MVAVALWGGDRILFALVFLTCEIGDPQSPLLCWLFGLWNCIVRFL